MLKTAEPISRLIWKTVDLPFSNNISENAIRPFTVGRKNWLFSDTPKGATVSAMVYTMVEMAKANNLNIYKYLNYLLEHRPNNKMSDDQLDQLAPWRKDAVDSCNNIMGSKTLAVPIS